jgi:two-component system sensor histidine kinase BaeS
VAVLLTGLVMLQLVPRAAQQQARDSLAAQANLAAAIVERQQGVGGRDSVPVSLVRLRQLLARQQIEVTVVRPSGRTVGGPDDPAGARAVLAGTTVSAVREVGGRTRFVEGRPAAGGGGVLLFQSAGVVRDSGTDARRRLLLAMLVGLVGGAAAGLVVARRTASPLRHLAAAARRLSTGARDVRVEPQGPAELAAVSDALNQLTAALAASEGRQREFLLSVSHELRTPLTAVKGYAEAMADGVLRPEDVTPTGRTMLAEARRLERLVSDLLDLARLGAEDFRLDLAEVDLADLVRQAATVWADRCAAAGVALRVDLPGERVVTHTDATRVRQIIDGLAENALRVTPAGAPIVLAVYPDGDAAVVQVRDGGPGLSQEDLEVVFERSALYDRYRGVRRVGTGVGLALVAGLTRRLGGTAHAGAAREGGACFTIRLPYRTRTQP